MKRFLSITASLALLVSLAADGLAQRSVGVRARQPDNDEQRVALVIGNSAYTRISKLRNPVNDARAMTRVLQQSGFQVTTLIDADRRGMLRAIERFGKKLRNGGAGLFYYAGHGVQARGRNYLIPLAARVEDVPDLEYEAIDAGRVLAKMESAKNRLNIVILDACRNNPYGSAFRSARNGLAQVNAPSGSLVAYATGPGKVAADGDGRNGLYTEQLIRHLRTPGLKLEEVFKRVRIDVQRLSGGKQVPWENTSVTGDFYFAGAAPSTHPAPIASTQPRPAPPPRQSLNAEEEFWSAIKNSKNPAHFRAYLDQYPKGRFAEIARIKIDLLAPAVKPPAPKRPQPAAIRRKPPSYARLQNLGPGRPLRTFTGHSDFCSERGVFSGRPAGPFRLLGQNP